LSPTSNDGRVRGHGEDRRHTRSKTSTTHRWVAMGMGVTSPKTRPFMVSVEESVPCASHGSGLGGLLAGGGVKTGGGAWPGGDTGGHEHHGGRD